MASVKLIIVLTLIGFSASAQTFEEWFSQRKTQKKYLLAQIEALRIYSNYIQKGYAVAKGGLGSITGHALEEFKLHTAYYDQLKRADPALKNNAKVKQIIAWQRDIIKQCPHWARPKVKAALLKDCEAQLTALAGVVNGTTEMSPAERLQQIELIHIAMLANLHFAVNFSAQLKRFDWQKQQEMNSNHALKRLYESH